MTAAEPEILTSARPELAAGEHLLEVDDLAVEFRTRDGVVHAVDGVSYTLDPGETLAILGESGSGKSVSAQAIMGILDMPPAFVTRGSVRYRGQDLLTMPEERRRKIRGASISMIFQDALSALNPVFPVGWQIAEMFRVHRGDSKAQARAHAIELMDRVQIPLARERVWDYPHQFSGGMRQRVMIAMALALDPDVLIANQPTTALDVTVQAQIMRLHRDVQGGRRLVRDQHRGVQRQGHRDHHALTHAAGELVRVVTDALAGSRDLHPLHQLDGLLLGLLARGPLVGPEHLTDLG